MPFHKHHGNGAALAADVLAEFPGQVVHFMRCAALPSPACTSVLQRRRGISTRQGRQGDLVRVLQQKQGISTKSCACVTCGIEDWMPPPDWRVPADACSAPRLVSDVSFFAPVSSAAVRPAPRALHHPIASMQETRANSKRGAACVGPADGLAAALLTCQDNRCTDVRAAALLTFKERRCTDGLQSRSTGAPGLLARPNRAPVRWHQRPGISSPTQSAG